MKNNKLFLHEKLIDILAFLSPAIGIAYIFKKAKFNKTWLIIAAFSILATGLFTYWDLFKNLN